MHCEFKNEKSIKLMKRLGFERELELRDNLIYFYLKRDSLDNSRVDGG